MSVVQRWRGSVRSRGVCANSTTENLLLSADRKTIYLADFGLAAISSSSPLMRSKNDTRDSSEADGHLSVSVARCR